MTTKIRLDTLLVKKKLCATKSEAQALILSGKVLINGTASTKAGLLVPSDINVNAIEIVERPKYVSRGGLKLAHALDVFNIQVSGLRAIDVGAATGGFTDCLLQNGASHVVAIDVGYGQLAWQLRQDSKITVLEKTNIKAVTKEQLGQHTYCIGVCDTAFISLKKALPPLIELLSISEQTHCVALLKPQFEYKDYLNNKHFKGVVKDPAEHQVIIQKTVAALTELLPNWCLKAMALSPITGPKEALAEDGVKTLDDFATCADWELAGGWTTVDGERVKD
ncbi:MAG: TlyA family RNA methyltransferase, partial [Cyanobacteria bacterium P01_H01_bin.74]